jgi:hypothetical protein
VTVELLVDGAELVATLDAEDREISGAGSPSTAAW